MTARTIEPCDCGGAEHPEAHAAAGRCGVTWHYRCRSDCPHPDHRAEGNTERAESREHITRPSVGTTRDCIEGCPHPDHRGNTEQ